MPNLPAGKITSGQFGLPRMPRGTDGYVLTGTGAESDPAYEAPEVGEKFYSETDDLSDVTRTTADYNPIGDGARVTIFTSGSAGLMLGGRTWVTTSNMDIEITVDGGAKQTLTPTRLETGLRPMLIPAIKFETSLLIQIYNHSGAARSWTGEVWSK